MTLLCFLVVRIPLLSMLVCFKEPGAFMQRYTQPNVASSPNPLPLVVHERISSTSLLLPLLSALPTGFLGFCCRCFCFDRMFTSKLPNVIFTDICHTCSTFCCRAGQTHYVVGPRPLATVHAERWASNSGTAIHAENSAS